MSESPTEQAPALVQAVLRALSADGPLAREDDAYLERSGQLAMAGAVAQAIEDRSTLVVEAGTGVGKTFAYLVPVLLAGKRTLVSTATKNLQDQLFYRDLPRLTEALAVPLTTALLKGRASYLCPYRMERARTEALRESNLQALRLGYEYAKEKFACPLPFHLAPMHANAGKILINGNTATALGCPATPAGSRRSGVASRSVRARS